MQSYKLKIKFLLFYAFLCISCQGISCQGKVNNENRVDNILNSNRQINIIKNSTEDGSPSGPMSVENSWALTPRIKSVAFSDVNRIWIITGQDEKLRFTENEGETWRILDFVKPIQQVEFFDEDNGWAIDFENIWTTNDGGNNWSGKLLSFKNPLINQIKMTGSVSGWLLDFSGLYFTSDKGDLWKRLFTSDKNSSPLAMFILDEKNAWFCDIGDNAGKVYKTTDGGASWTSNQLHNKPYRNCKVFFINSKEGWYSSGNFFFVGEFFFTKDGGDNWKKFDNLPSNFTVNSMYWFNSNIGWLVGTSNKGKGNNTKPKGVALKTEDGGKTFTEIKIKSDSPFFSKIHFSSSTFGYLVTRDELFISKDGGSSWKLVYKLPKLLSDTT